MEQIVVYIDKMGQNVEAETMGSTGQSCADTLAHLFVGVNGTIEDAKKKPEFWDSAEVSISVQAK